MGIAEELKKRDEPRWLLMFGNLLQEETGDEETKSGLGNRLAR